MQTPTLIPGNQQQDDEHNIGQKKTDDLLNRLSNGERRPGTIDMGGLEDQFSAPSYDGPSDPTKRIAEKEAEASKPANWVDNASSTPAKTKVKGRFKKIAPALGIGGGIGIGGLILIALVSPSLLFVQMKEVMVGRFNTQLATMEARSNKLLVSKVQGSTKGFCSTKVSIACKFTTMSEKQKKKLAAAGIEVKGEETITGRTKPSSLVFNGKEISPKDFSKMANTDVEFRSALKQAYKPLHAGFVGKAWAKAAAKFKTSKKPPELGAAEDPEKAKKKLNDIAKEGTKDSRTRTAVISEEDCKGKPTGCITNEEADKAKQQALEIEDGGKNGSAAADVRSKLSGLSGGAIGSAFKVTGVIDSGCQVYGAMATLSYATKVIRAAQLVRYAMVFFNVADAIKAGASPDSKDIAFLGGIATQTIKDPSDSTKTLVGSMTDSYGYKYAAYGDSSAPEKNMKIANRFMAGGGFVGELSASANAALAVIPGGRASAKSVCGTLANPLVQGASVIVGVAMLFIPGINIGKAAMGAAATAAASAAIAILPGLLADTLAGTVTENIAGEETGNAITSGAGALMSDTLAAENGNGPMMKDDAVQYAMLQKQTNDQYIADSLRTTSPFDATNPHTFVGSIVSTLLPLQSKSNPLTTIGSLLSTSVAKITPSSQALTTEQYKKSLDVCQDIDIQEAGYAADPFCNVIRGIPTRYLDKDPVEVVEQLQASGELSDDGVPQGNYADFVKKCISMSAPLGYSSADTGYDAGEASSCIVNDSNANYYLNYADQRVDLGQSDEDTETNSTTSTLTGKYVFPVDLGYRTPAQDTDWGDRDICSGSANSYCKFHRGVDFTFGGEGQPVYAVADGEVVETALGNPGCARSTSGQISMDNRVLIRHADGTTTGYSHMPVSAIQAAGISVGTKVKAGQKIGEIGDCGNSQGAHLHFSVNPGDATDPKITSIASNNNGETYIDPAAYMLLYGVDIMGKRYTDGR